MNNFIKKARPTQKHPVATSWEQTTDTQKGLSKVEGILTSAIQFKYETEIDYEEEKTNAYCYAFFQLEGIDTEIPVIFKLDNCSDNPEADKPDIPPRAKVLLEGKWANSDNSNRPSFTCWAYQILANPSPPTIKSLREQISSLLTTSLEKQSEWKQRTDYLFRKRKDLEELDKLDKLPFEYLQAYLLLRQAHYANYQDNLLQHATDLDNAEAYLTKIQAEIEEIAQHIRAYQSKE
jgi:hypothetical protein